MVSEAEREKLRSLPQRLKRAIVGQDAAVDLVAARLQHGELGLTTSGRPKASFLFLGPTGVGKTELTQQFTAELCGPEKLVRLDMSEYQTRDSLSLLLGTSRDEPGRIAEGFDACVVSDAAGITTAAGLVIVSAVGEAACVSAGGDCAGGVCGAGAGCEVESCWADSAVDTAATASSATNQPARLFGRMADCP